MPVAMITGGGSWMSLWTARRLIEDGWNIELSDIDPTAMSKVVSELGRPDVVRTETLDVTDLDKVRESVKEPLNNCPGSRAVVQRFLK